MFLGTDWLVIGWSLVGHWLVIGWSLVGHWLVIGWSFPEDFIIISPSFQPIDLIDPVPFHTAITLW